MSDPPPMARRYDSSRRKRAANATRERILRAALKLHWEGVTAYEPLAREAGCSLPTLRKHFPTKEALFGGCTRAFAETLTMPDLHVLAQIDDPARRVEHGVRELCRIHEAMFGYAWLGAHLRQDSPTLDAEMTAYQRLTDAVAAIVTAANPHQAEVVRGLLDFLTYRALRTAGGLPPEGALATLLAILHPLLSIRIPFDPSTSIPEPGAP